MGALPGDISILNIFIWCVLFFLSIIIFYNLGMWSLHQQVSRHLSSQMLRGMKHLCMLKNKKSDKGFLSAAECLLRGIEQSPGRPYQHHLLPHIVSSYFLFPVRVCQKKMVSTAWAGVDTLSFLLMKTQMCAWQMCVCVFWAGRGGGFAESLFTDLLHLKQFKAKPWSLQPPIPPLDLFKTQITFGRDW